MSLNSTTHASQRLPELLDLAYRQDERFQVKRDNQPIAWIVGVSFMTQISELVEQIITHQPELADSLAISLDPHIRRIIQEGTQEVQTGKLLPLATILDD